ncbi:MAG TPA: lipid-A-disaccharide synthase [Myxococcales bacterium]|nr:lipid-A-disaccharide synthase [Myxococcales bacterium]
MSAQILVVAGEASGDQHAAAVVREIRRRMPEARFFGMGGARLAAEGVDLIYRAEEISVMGVVEVLPKLRRILKVMEGLERAAARRRPACALLVDVPDFNLRLARALKRMGVKVAYYVSPMIWAWRPGRVHQVGARVDRMLCILPFEVPFYRRAGVSAEYVGSPVLEHVPPPAPAPELRRRLGLSPEAPALALLPGSRMSEIRRIAPALAEAGAALRAKRPGLQLVVPVAPGLPEGAVREAFAAVPGGVALVAGRAPEVVGAGDVAVVASGTAVLEAGLMERPLVVVYRVAPLTGLLGRMLLKVRHVSLVNLLAGREVVPELLQGDFTAARVVAEVERLWGSAQAREQMLAGLREVRAALAGPAGANGPGASARAAAAVVELCGGTG